MSSFRRATFASATVTLIVVTVMATLGMALSALSPAEAGAATRHSTARVVRAGPAGLRATRAATRRATRRAEVRAAAVASTATTTKAASSTGTGAQFEVCKVAGDASLDGVSAPIIEGNWSGSFYTSYSLTAEPSPGTCGPKHAFTPGAMVLVEEAASPGVPVPGVTPTFSVSNGTVDSVVANLEFVAVTVKSGLTVLTITNRPTPPPQQGTLELCKSAADKYVEGTFSFSVTAAGFKAAPSVLTGQCNDITVPSGNVSVTENVEFPYAVTSMAAIPKAALVSSDLNTQNALVAVVPGGTTTLFVTNATLTGYVKVCKSLARSVDNVLVGTTFNFSVGASFRGATITGIPTSVSVVATSFGTPTCTFLSDNRGPVALPLGSLVTVNETGLPVTIQSVGTSVSPSNLNAGSSLSTASLYVGNQPPPNNVGNLGAGSVTQATFTNEALGYVEVCKQSSSINPGTPFNFTIGGVGPIQPVDVGLCSLGFLLPIGTTTISETPVAHVTLQKVTSTSGATLSGNTATVTVPYGTENIVTFFNEINTGTLKICKAQTSSDAGLQNTTFNLTYSYVHNGTTVQGPNEPLTPGQCTLPIGPVPVLNSNLTPIQISITEQTTSVADVGLFNVTVVGGDTVVTAAAPPTHLVSTPGGSAATEVVRSLEGITNVTFINGIDITG
jgi:hypothetical protein